MKTINYYILLLPLIMFLLLFSCEKMIEVDNPINQITTDEVYQDSNTAYAALEHLYTELQTNSIFAGGSSGFGALLGAYTDDLDFYVAPGASDNVDIYLNQILPANSVVKSTWTNAYKEIYMANAVIAGVEGSSLSVQDKNKIKGEALLIRSMVYFGTFQVFGEIPYTTTTDYAVNQLLGKTSEAEMLQLLKNDTQNAVELLSNDYRNSERIFVNKKVGQMLLANILLMQKNWTEAEQLCRQVINDSNYSFETDIKKVFKKSGKHILFQLKPLTAATPVPETRIYYFTSVPPLNYVLRYNLVNSFSTSDLRRSNWMTAVGTSTVYFRNEKYKNITTNNDEYSVVYRLEQVYFMLAEALLQQRKTSDAITWINKTRQRAGISLLSQSLDNESAFNEMLAEKRREFFAEQGQRFYDLKRLGELDVLKFIKPNWQDYQQRWPLPVSELLLNANLKPQNENY